MRLTAQEEYGLRCLLRVARGQESMTTPEIAVREGLTQAHVHKLMRLLRRGGLVKSVRGRNGGYQLARPAEEINVGAALAALGDSFYSSACSIRSLWIAIDHAVQHALQSTKLSDLLRTEPEMAGWIRAQPDLFPLIIEWCGAH